METNQEIPYGYCHCGCGQKTNICQETAAKRGRKKGEPYLFILGHAMRRPTEERFWAKIDKRGPDDCWPWIGTATKSGYGIIEIGYHMKGVHRVSYELHYGPIPKGLFCCHTCDQKLCVNPAHLFVGTAKDNTQDMMRKDRQNFAFKKGHVLSRGENHVNSRLTELDIRAIRSRYAQGDITYKELSNEYGVCIQNICNIVLRKIWKHVE